MLSVHSLAACGQPAGCDIHQIELEHGLKAVLLGESSIIRRNDQQTDTKRCKEER
jgi:hypothetical protein